MIRQEPVDFRWPLPPSANHAWGRKGRATYPSAGYKRWLGMVHAVARENPVRQIRGPVSIEITVVPGKGWRQNMDISNRVKVTEDALVRLQVIPDDCCRYVRRVTVKIGRPDGTPAHVLVRVIPRKRGRHAMPRTAG